MIWTNLICSNCITFRLNTTQLLAQHISSLLIHRGHLLGSFPMTLRNQFFEMLRHHSWTSAYAIFLTLIEVRTQLNTLLSAGAFFSQIADNRRWISDGLTPSFHRNRVVFLCSWLSPSVLRPSAPSFDHYTLSWRGSLSQACKIVITWRWPLLAETCSYFLLLNTIINPYYHRCGFMTDIYLAISLCFHSLNQWVIVDRQVWMSSHNVYVCETYVLLWDICHKTGHTSMNIRGPQQVMAKVRADMKSL